MARDFGDLAVRLAGAGYEAIAVNPRSGDVRAGTSQPTLHDLASDVADVISELHLEPAHVVGHAFGNRIARCLAADRPELIRSLVLLAAGGKYPPEPAALETARRFLEGELTAARRLDEEARLAAVQSVWFTEHTDGRAWLNGWDPLQIMAFTAASDATVLDDWWGGGSAPMLIIQGLEDRIAPPPNGRDLRDSCPDRVSLIELRGTAHALLPEEPELIASAIVQFLGAIDREREFPEGGQV
jgi:pimeloyl-ACP methyl ester carboxylesterase